MKRFQYFVMLGIVLGMASSCVKEDKVSYEYRDLGENVKQLKVSKPSSTSLFDDLKVYYSIPLDKEFVDAKTKAKIKIKLDSIVAYHKYTSSTGGGDLVDHLERVAGHPVMENDTSYTYKLDNTLILNETYFLYSYFRYYRVEGGKDVEITDYNTDFYKVLYTQYVPTIVEGSNVVFGTTRNGMGSAIINPYDGDMLVNFNLPAFFTAPKAINTNYQRALLLKAITVISNNGNDYVVWDIRKDTVNNKLRFLPKIPAPEAHMIGNVYYTVNFQMYVMTKNANNTWSYTIDRGDTSIWNSNKVFVTQELYVPGKVIAKISPAEAGKITIDSLPTVQMTRKAKAEEFYNGVHFRPRMNRFVLYKGEDSVASSVKFVTKGDYVWASSDSIGQVLEPLNSYLSPFGTYSLQVSAYWEYKADSTWKFTVADGKSIAVRVKDSIWHPIRVLGFTSLESYTSKFTTIQTYPGAYVSALSPKAENTILNPQIVATVNGGDSTIVVQGKVQIRPILDSLALYKTGKIYIPKFKLETQNKPVINLDSALYPYTDYQIIARSHWEYKNKNGVWTIFNTDGVKIDNRITQSFSTIKSPNNIYSDINLTRTQNPLNAKPIIYLAVKIGDKNSSELNVIVNNGLDFRAIVDTVKVLNGTLVVPHSVNFDVDGQLIELIPQSFYNLITTYNISFIAHWEYRASGTSVWKRHPDAANLMNESINRSFKTADIPGVIVGSLIPQSYITTTAPVDTSRLPLDTIATAYTNYSIDSSYTYAGTEFIPVIDSFYVVNSNNVKSTGTINSNSKREWVFAPLTNYTENMKYTSKVWAHWKYLSGSTYLSSPAQSTTQVFYTVKP